MLSTRTTYSAYPTTPPPLVWFIERIPRYAHEIFVWAVWAVQAETPDGGVITSTRNEDYHKGYPGSVACNCRGVSRSTDGGTTFAGCQPAPALVGPVCQATMATVPTPQGLAIFHANPGASCRFRAQTLIYIYNDPCVMNHS